MLIDEVHTPDSSRFWLDRTYADRFASGLEPENFDKEFVRLAYTDKGFRAMEKFHHARGFVGCRQ